MSGLVKGIFGGDDAQKKALEEQKKRIEEQKRIAEAEKASQVKEQSAKVKTMTGGNYGQRSLLSPTRQTLG
ncbi:MAG: hypothetical protein HGA87_01515 [Desulfobulbaceae bacterium]|nr:hypothetical protein [Desulfobulbaceae bacterium]